MKKPKVQQKTERRISAALRLVLVAVLLLAQIALVLVLNDLLRQRMAIAYTLLELVALAYVFRPGESLPIGQAVCQGRFFRSPLSTPHPLPTGCTGCTG